MGLLTKLKSLLGFEEDRSQVRRSESGVTIEREPDEPTGPDADERTPSSSAARQPDAETEGVDVGGEESFDTEAGETETPEGIEEAETEADVESEGEVEPTPEVTDDETAPAGDETAETDDAASETEEAEASEVAKDAEESEKTEDSEAAEAAEPDEETETADDAETTEEAAGAGEPLEDVKGIGPAYAERLREAGVADVAELAAADADRLADETDLSAKRISSWIEQAQAR